MIDQVFILFGAPEYVYLDVRNQRNKAKSFDNFQLYMYYKDLKVVLSASERCLLPGPHYLIHGEKGSCIIYGMDQQERKLGEQLHSSKLEKKDDKGVIRYIGLEGNIIEKNFILPCGDYGQFYEEVYSSLVYDKPFRVKKDEVLNVLRIMEKAIESVKLHERVKFT